MSWIHWMGKSAARSRVELIVTVAVVLAGLAGSPSANAQALGAIKTTGISQTKHNLGSGGTGVNHLDGTNAQTTTEVCVFCHTPHAANTSAGPLWNRVTLTGTITPYTSATLTGGSVAGTADAPGSISLACLSCHDGVQAMNVLINAPGSGGYTPAGAAFGVFATGGASKITGVANIGTDLTNDHPIGVKYAGGAAAGSQANAGYNEMKTGTINTATAFWVDSIGDSGSGLGSRQKTDMWLYARSGLPYVECASCHDPHTNDAPTFLRISNAYSSVCLSCHIK